MSEALRNALEAGELTREQLEELIALEASELGIGFDEAIRRARGGNLPHTPVGMDLELLVQLLDQPHADAA